jgi:hypothetical protein
MTAPKDPPDLMAETERLVTKLVRNARSGRVIKDPETGKIRRVPYDILDQARAADSALRLLQVKNKLQPEVEENEFDQQLREFHGQGSGGTDSAKEPPANGRTSTAH